MNISCCLFTLAVVLYFCTHHLRGSISSRLARSTGIVLYLDTLSIKILATLTTVYVLSGWSPRGAAAPLFIFWCSCGTERPFCSWVDRWNDLILPKEVRTIRITDRRSCPKGENNLNLIPPWSYLENRRGYSAKISEILSVLRTYVPPSFVEGQITREFIKNNSRTVLWYGGCDVMWWIPPDYPEPQARTLIV